MTTLFMKHRGEDDNTAKGIKHVYETSLHDPAM